MSVKRWKLGWKRCECVKCDHALTVEQTEENCGWVMWEHHKEEVARLKAEVERLRKAGRPLYDWYLETTDCDCDKCNTIKGEWLAAEGGQS